LVFLIRSAESLPDNSRKRVDYLVLVKMIINRRLSINGSLGSAILS
jgi:hypothetical protein